MSLIDTHGRLFGRVNLIDAAMLGVVLCLIPLGFTIRWAFMTPNPYISAVTPETVYADTTGQQVRVTGVDFRPYLRVFLDQQRLEAEITSPTNILIRLPAVSVGAYDLTLNDDAREVQRLRNAIVAQQKPPQQTPPQRRPLHGARYVVEREERLEVGEHVWVFSIVRDGLAQTCELYRNGQPVGAVSCE